MLFRIDRELPVPLAEQLAEQIRLLVDSGELEPGEGLPTIKEAADALSINANTVAAVYRRLEQEGYLTQRKRAGTTVAQDPPRRLERDLADTLAAETAARAAAAGLDASQLVRAVVARTLAQGNRRQVRVGVLAPTMLSAVELSLAAGATLGSGVECIPVTPAAYVSVDYHLTVVAPELTHRLASRDTGEELKPPPAQLRYGPEFPAGAD